MDAIILAAGQAKRLKPLTNDLPKCLLEISGTTIIDHQINCLKQNGIKNIILVVGFQSKKLTDYVSQKHPSINFEFIINNQFETTNAAYSLWLAKNHLNNAVIYLNSDSFFHPRIIEQIIKSKKDSITAIQRTPWDEEEVKVKIKNKSLIVEMGKDLKEKESYGEFIGVTKLGKKFNPDLVKSLDLFISEKENKKFAADAINLTINKFNKKMHILDVTQWPAIEIDTVQDYKNAQELWGKL
ncbi:MAG TPA: phosphocholine cytidylyltransferase family protein [Candidatus Magasanikbacteria bacterium]|nr:phosphocholine cytidylyltransferase family protein [Candidatus Magasanikbacteria bacterium]